MNFTGQVQQLNNMLNALQYPQQVLSSQVFNQMIKENPDKWAAARQMFIGKDYSQSVAELKKLYQSKGMNLEATARQYGVKL